SVTPACCTNDVAAAFAASSGPPDMEPEASMASTVATGTVDSATDSIWRSVTGCPSTVISTADTSGLDGKLLNSMISMLWPPSPYREPTKSTISIDGSVL